MCLLTTLMSSAYGLGFISIKVCSVLFCSYGIISKGLKNMFEIAVVNKPSVFEPLMFYCITEQTICSSWY